MNNDLRDKVVALENYPEELKGNIQEMIDQSKERTVKPWERILMGIALPVLIMALLAFMNLIYNEWDRIVEKPFYIMASIPLTLLLMIGTIALIAKSLIKGTERAFDVASLCYATFGFTILWVVCEMILGGGVDGDLLAAVIIVGVCVICTYVHTAELRQREHTLRGELAVAELTEIVRRQSGNE